MSMDMDTVTTVCRKSVMDIHMDTKTHRKLHKPKSCMVKYAEKFLKIRTPQKPSVIILKLEQCGLR